MFVFYSSKIQCCATYQQIYYLNRNVCSENVVSFGGKDIEIYFEEDNFGAFIEKLQTINNVEYVHPAIEHRWGQRAVRFYDPDMHIIEVGENLKAVCRHFLDSGMHVDDVAERMNVPVKFVHTCISLNKSYMALHYKKQ